MNMPPPTPIQRSKGRPSTSPPVGRPPPPPPAGAEIVAVRPASHDRFVAEQTRQGHHHQSNNGGIGLRFDNEYDNDINIEPERPIEVAVEKKDLVISTCSNNSDDDVIDNTKNNDGIGDQDDDDDEYVSLCSTNKDSLPEKKCSNDYDHQTKKNYGRGIKNDSMTMTMKDKINSMARSREEKDDDDGDRNCQHNDLETNEFIVPLKPLPSMSGTKRRHHPTASIHGYIHDKAPEGMSKDVPSKDQYGKSIDGDGDITTTNKTISTHGNHRNSLHSPRPYSHKRYHRRNSFLVRFDHVNKKGLRTGFESLLAMPSLTTMTSQPTTTTTTGGAAATTSSSSDDAAVNVPYRDNTNTTSSSNNNPQQPWRPRRSRRTPTAAYDDMMMEVMIQHRNNNKHRRTNDNGVIATGAGDGRGYGSSSWRANNCTSETSLYGSFPFSSCRNGSRNQTSLLSSALYAEDMIVPLPAVPSPSKMTEQSTQGETKPPSFALSASSSLPSSSYGSFRRNNNVVSAMTKPDHIHGDDFEIDIDALKNMEISKQMTSSKADNKTEDKDDDVDGTNDDGDRINLANSNTCMEKKDQQRQRQQQQEQETNVTNDDDERIERNFYASWADSNDTKWFMDLESDESQD